MNQSVDDKLRAARHAERGSDAALDQMLKDLVRGAESTAPVRRRIGWRLRTKWVVGGAAAALVLGTASTAAATQPWLWNRQLAHPDSATTITLPSGNVCEIRAVVQGEAPGSQDEKQTLEAARSYAKTIDLRALDLEGIRNSMLKSERISSSSSLDDQYFYAISDHVSDMIFSYVSQHKLSGAISVYSQNHCTSPR